MAGTIGIIGGAIAGAPATPAETWTRPAEWPTVPESQANELHGIVAVHDVPLGAIIAFSVTVVGGYTVDWGDGTVDNVASGVTAEHIYDYSNVNLPAAIGDGSKLAVVSVSSTTPGAAWTAVTLDKRHSSLLRDTIQTWVEWDLNAPSLTSAADVRGSGVGPTVRNVRVLAPALSSMPFYMDYDALENLHCDMLGASASLSYLCYGCAALVKVRLYGTQNITSFQDAFTNCRSLTDINSPLETGSATNVASMFSGAAALKNVPEMSLPNVTSASNMLQNAGVADVLPTFGIPPGASFNAFAYSAPITYGEITTSNSASQCFNDCPALVRARINGTPTSLAQSFYNCPALQDVEVADASAVTNTSWMLNTGGLQRLILNGIAITFTCENQNMSATALNNLFTSLGTAVGQTVTVKGNPGAATCDTSIATAKGWTVVTA